MKLYCQLGASGCFCCAEAVAADQLLRQRSAFAPIREEFLAVDIDCHIRCSVAMSTDTENPNQRQAAVYSISPRSFDLF